MDGGIAAEGGGADAVHWRMLSQTAEYAVRGVLYIAAWGGGERVGAARAASDLGIPERYLARVLNVLTRQGLLESSRGVHGGFRLARRAQEVTLAEVVAPFDAAGAAPRCLLRERSCSGSDPCAVHEQWHGVADSVRQFFVNTTIADLVAAGVPPVPVCREESGQDAC